jgi:hypothetical protein
MVRFAKQNCTGTKHMASAKKRSSSKGPSVTGKQVSHPAVKAAVRGRPKQTAGKSVESRYAICVRNDDYPASLELRKLYAVLEDRFAAEHGMVRVIDESGEDYLYPSEFFLNVELPISVERVLAKIA